MKTMLMMMMVEKEEKTPQSLVRGNIAKLLTTKFDTHRRHHHHDLRYSNSSLKTTR